MFQGVLERYDACVRTEPCRDKRRGRLCEADGRLGLHPMMQRRDEASVEGVAAPGSVCDLDPVCRNVQPGTVLMRIAGPVSAEGEHATLRSPVEVEGCAVFGG